VGAYVINGDGTDQTLGLSVDGGVAAVYFLRVWNAGNVTEQFRIFGPAAPAGWTVRFFNATSGGTDITYAVTHSGWLTAPLGVHVVQDFRVEVTPGSSLPSLSSLDVLVRMKPTADLSKLDAVKATTTKN
jgi:hypothetical protein